MPHTHAPYGVAGFELFLNGRIWVFVLVQQELDILLNRLSH